MAALLLWVNLLPEKFEKKNSLVDTFLLIFE